jgi:acetylglutamate kinase
MYSKTIPKGQPTGKSGSNPPSLTRKPILLFKYGGNAMTNHGLQIEVLRGIANLKSDGYQVVIVHGGGPFIKEALNRAGIQSQFIDGHRVTTSEIYTIVEMALKGQVNSTLVGILNQLGFRAVGLSGKDAGIVTARKRWHYHNAITGREQIDYTKADLFMGSEMELVMVLNEGKPVSYDRNYMKKLLRESHVYVKLDLNVGQDKATAWGTDLTTDYVLFNSVYTT